MVVHRYKVKSSVRTAPLGPNELDFPILDLKVKTKGWQVLPFMKEKNKLELLSLLFSIQTPVDTNKTSALTALIQYIIPLDCVKPILSFSVMRGNAESGIFTHDPYFIFIQHHFKLLFQVSFIHSINWRCLDICTQNSCVLEQNLFTCFMWVCYQSLAEDINQTRIV